MLPLIIGSTKLVKLTSTLRSFLMRFHFWTFLKKELYDVLVKNEQGPLPGRGGRCSLFLMMRCFNNANFPNPSGAIFSRYFRQNIDLKFFYEKPKTSRSRCILAMFFQTKENSGKCHKFFQLQITRLNFFIYISLWSSWNLKNYVKRRAFSLTMQCFGDIFEKPLTSMFLTMFFKTRKKSCKRSI